MATSSYESREFFPSGLQGAERSQRQRLLLEGMPQGLAGAPEMMRAWCTLFRLLLRPPYMGPLPAASQSSAGEREGSWPRRAFSKVLIAANSQLPRASSKIRVLTHPKLYAWRSMN